jgi:SAM-dependent methyltransferase
MSDPRRRVRSRSYRYILGDTSTEAARLRAQAALWDPTACELFDRIGVRRGWKVLEIGPGQGSLHVELRRRVRAPVDFVEPSDVFRARLETLCAKDGFGRGDRWDSTLDTASLPRGRYDLIFARWVFLFLPNPQQHVRRLAASLKPGGLLAIEDYRRETLSMIPTPAEWPAFMAADAAFFSTNGGDVSIASALPAFFEKAGLDLVDITPTIRTGHPGSPVWAWLSSYFLGVMDHMASFRPFDHEQARRLRRHWLASSRKKTSLLIGPALIDVVGRRRA